MTTSELMKAMADAGAPFEAILIAVQALDAKDAEIAHRDREQADKRAKDADRKRQDRADGKLRRRRPRTFQGRSTECPADPPIEDHTPPVSSNDETIPPAKASKVSGPAKPDGVSDLTWSDFLAVRKRKRSDMTETALVAIRREAEKAGWTLESALAECVARGWQAFKADWVKDSPKPQSATLPAAVDPLMRSIMAMKAREASP